jgi:hypothetical protein
MIEIKNLLFQPLTLRRTGGGGLHLGPREKAKLPEADVSEEMKRAEARGLIALKAAEETETETVTPAEEPSEEIPTSKRRKEK